MPIIRNKTVDRRLSPADLFCNMSASKAFRSHIAVESAKRCLIESVKLAGGEL